MEANLAIDRKRAFEDGRLVDVTIISSPIGVDYSMAVSREVWKLCHVVPEHYGRKRAYLRLWNLVNSLHEELKADEGNFREVVAFEPVLEFHPDHYEKASAVAVYTRLGSDETNIYIFLKDELH